MGRSNIDKICFSKTPHETEEDVLEHIEYLEETTGQRFDYYKCPICGKYHLTSKRKKK